MSSKLAGKRKYSPEMQGVAIYKPYARPYKRRRVFAPAQARRGRYASRAGELKFHDVDLDDAVVAAGGAVTATVNIIPQGVTESQRIGRKCTIKMINWRYRLTLPEQDAVATPAESETVRVIMYIDKQCNGATAAVTDVLETADWQSFRNLANSGRFQFLMDKNYVMNYVTLASDGAGVVSQGRMVYEDTFYKKCDIPIEFNSTLGVIAEIRSNNIGVLLIPEQGVATFASKIRLRFSDN